jgi:hypothetical protein
MKRRNAVSKRSAKLIDPFHVGAEEAAKFDDD